MKRIYQVLISLILIVLLADHVFGYRDYATNNTTESDQNIEISLHLIEVEADRLDLQDKLYVHETIVFRNAGTKIFSGTLKTWVPDGVLEIKVMKAQMVAEIGGQSIVTEQNGNIISWQDYIEANNVSMYVIEYLLLAEPKGYITKSKYYSKKLLYPTLINYQYFPTPGYPVFILKVSKSKDSSITILDENRNKIIAQDVSEEDSSIISRFSELQFKELNIELSKSAIDLSQIGLYLVIGVLIVLVLAYPVIRTKSPKLMEFEEEKSALVAKLEELEKDYASGNLIDEEYEELRNSYQEKLKK